MYIYTQYIHKCIIYHQMICIYIYGYGSKKGYGSLPGDPDVWNEGVSSKWYGPPVSPGYGWGLYILSCRYMYILPESYIYNIYIMYIYIYTYILCIILYNTNFKQDICHCNTLSLSDPNLHGPLPSLVVVPA